MDLNLSLHQKCQLSVSLSQHHSCVFLVNPQKNCLLLLTDRGEVEWGGRGVLANGSYSITSSIVSAIIRFTISTSFLCIPCKPTEKLASSVG